MVLRDEAILANMNEGLLLYAPDGRILLANTAAETLWRSIGLPLPATQEEILDSLEWVRSGDRLLPLEACPSGRLLQGQSFANYEVALKFKGMPRPQECSYSGVPALDAGGELLYGILTFRDIAEQNRLEADRRELERQFQRTQKLESLGGLAGGVAHELNNVLGAIMAMASSQEEGADSGTPLRRDMESILKACLRGRALVQGLLGFARQDFTQQRVLDLNALVRDQLELLAGIALDRVVVNTELEAHLSPVQGDPATLGQAILNLCLNAVEAMPTGGFMSLRTRNEGSQEVLLEIKDTGTGMSLEVLARSLDPFFTTKLQGKSTGLGLPMAYGAIRVHQGSLDIQSLPGQGTTVTIRLPASLPGGVTQPPRESPAKSAKTSLFCLDILVVADEDYVRVSLTKLVEALGHRPIPASSGEVALRILMEGTRVDLVVLDLKMPGLGGGGHPGGHPSPATRAVCGAGYWASGSAGHGPLPAVPAGHPDVETLHPCRDQSPPGPGRNYAELSPGQIAFHGPQDLHRAKGLGDPARGASPPALQLPGLIGFTW